MNPWTWQHPDWPHFACDTVAVGPALAEARCAVEACGAAVTLLAEPDLVDFELTLGADEGVATSGIEGIQIDSSDLRASLAKRLGLPSRVRTSKTGESLAALLDEAASGASQPLDAATLCRWQALLFPDGRSGHERIRTGGFRQGPITIASGGKVGTPWTVHYEAVPAERVVREIAALLDWLQATRGDGTDSLVRAALAHLRFECIHPFEDGNGRVGRALVERALAEGHGTTLRLFSLSRQLEQHKRLYLEALDVHNRPASDRPLDATPWVAFFARQVQEAALDARRRIDGVVRRARFWSAHGADGLNARQAKVINAWLGFGAEAFPGGIGNARFASIGQGSRASATRDLADMVARGILVPVEGRGGRSRAYRFASEDVWAGGHGFPARRSARKP